MDVFRMTGHPCGHIKLQMTVMAKNLLLEEYPLAEKEIVRNTNFWMLDVDVYPQKSFPKKFCSQIHP